MDLTDSPDELVSDEMLLDAFISDPSLLWRSEGGQKCWGGLLQGDESGCTIGFCPGSNHFKNKMCPACRQNGITIPSDRIRALDPSEWQSVTDRSTFGTGLWTPAGGGKYECRLINHTAKCTGPRLLIYRHPPAPAERASWTPMPAGWLGSSGQQAMKLVVALGTLRPVVAMNPANRSRSITSGLASSTAAAAAAAPAEEEEDGMRPTEEAISTDLEPASKRTRALLVADAHMAGTSACDASIDDINAVRAAVNDETFQQRHNAQLRVCSASFSTLNSHGREIMHEMFCDSTLRALGAIAGDAPVCRVLATFRQHRERIVSTMEAAAAAPSAAPEISSSTRLVMCCACLHDLETWAVLVEAVPGLGVASGEPVALSGAQPPSDWLAHFTNAFARVSVDASWRPCVERTLALQQRMVQTALTGPAHKWVPYSFDSKDSRAQSSFCLVDTVFISQVEMDVAVVDEAFESHPTGEAVCSEASAILRHLIEEQHGKTKQTFSNKDGVWDRLVTFTPSGLLERISWHLAGMPHFTTRCIEERLDDSRGCRLVFARWDEEQDKLWCEADSGLTVMSTMTVTYEKSTRSWRLANSDLMPFPQRSLSLFFFSSAVTHGLSHMGSVCASLEYQRLQHQFTDVIKQRTAATQFVC